MEQLKVITEIIQAIITSISIIVGGIWVYWKFVLQQERYPNINFSADINVVGVQRNFKIIELIALIENKGKAQHKIKEFTFELSGLKDGDPINTNDRYGGQVDFINLLCQGSFLPQNPENDVFFFVDPGTMAKYSFIARVPIETTFLILHTNFKYDDRRNYGHTAEKTIKLKPE